MIQMCLLFILIFCTKTVFITISHSGYDFSRVRFSLLYTSKLNVEPWDPSIDSGGFKNSGSSLCIQALIDLNIGYNFSGSGSWQILLRHTPYLTVLQLSSFWKRFYSLFNLLKSHKDVNCIRFCYIRSRWFQKRSQKLTDRRTDNRWSEMLTWTFGSGEL